MATLTAFYDTKNLYREATLYTKPMSFEEWNSSPFLHKAPLLFVQFYPQITLACDKANAYNFIPGEEGVSTVCQYLEKNVPIIEKNPNRFTKAYIYKVAYNCLYCICHDRKSENDRWENETSGIVVLDGKEVNLFDTVIDKSTCPENKIEANEFRRDFWRAVEDIGVKAEKVMRYLLSNDVNDLKKLNPRAKAYKTDPLQDVEVKPEEVAEIVNKLRDKFLSMSKDSACGEYISKFSVLASFT